MSLSESQPYTVAVPGAAGERKRESSSFTETQTKTAVTARFPDQGS